MVNRLEVFEGVFGYGGKKKGGEIVRCGSLCFQSGDFVVLHGRNGSGKSTVLRTLGMIHPPLGGRFLWNGEDWTLLTPQERARRVAVMTTGFPTMGLFSAFDTAALGRAPYTGWRGRLTLEDEQRVLEALKATGSLELKERVFDSLSDGEKQKVMAARAVAQQTPLLLLDEPTAFLDYEAKPVFFRFLSQLAREEGKIVILSTHDIPYVKEFHPRLILCHQGDLREEG